MYFPFFKLHSWGKRSAVRRRRFIQRLLKRLQMTPQSINWDSITKFDATALPIAFVLLGTLALLFGTNGQ